MNKKLKVTGVVCISLSAVMTVGLLAGCGGSNQALVIMTEELNGLFNPFYATSGTDMDVVGMTQISMLTTDKDGNPACGEDEAVVVLDYDYAYNPTSDTTTYQFVIKNGITFSDGVPLTMNDILFNMYVYLDSAYTGSTTMYSTDIVGLTTYRLQEEYSNDTDASNAEDELTTNSNQYAKNRSNELITAFRSAGRTTTAGSYDADDAKMRAEIDKMSISTAYMQAVGAYNFKEDKGDEAMAREQLLADYENTLAKFREELEEDYASAASAYKDSETYTKWPQFDDEIFCFMFYENYIDVEYATVNGVKDRSTITKLGTYSSTIKSKEDAINYVYDVTVQTKLDQILQYWSTGTKLLSEYASKAREVLLHMNLEEGELKYPNIEGIVSLGHSADAPTRVTIKGKDYAVAKQHNEDGTPVNEGEYDVLQITINKQDPKAIFNFAFTVAPYHYYSDPETYKVDIANNDFGVAWASFDFQSKVIQGGSKNQVPLGAGPYIATNSSSTTNLPSGTGFFSSNIVYYRANHNFMLGTPNIEYVRYQVISASNAITMLQNGNVDFITPQFTEGNYKALSGLSSKGIEMQDAWQLGYGYVGINAGLVPNINIRRAIMSAMDSSLAISYYTVNGDAKAITIDWPMSLVSWAYPVTDSSHLAIDDNGRYRDQNNGWDYTMFTNDEAAIDKIKSYMNAAGVSPGADELKIKLTIAGSSLTEHPVYNVFVKAMNLLNSCGWDVEISADINALVKLSTGSLQVWAAAWGSTIDPDMYQVYHKNSTATSVYAWGYREIIGNPGLYPTETAILNSLSEKIDDGRSMTEPNDRKPIYKEAMKLALQLSVELPIYQRMTLYAYNAKVIDKNSFPEEINPYTSPLSRIWEIKFA